MQKKYYALQPGFTLIEILITVAIVSVLVCVAYPVYTDSALKAYRAEARSALHSTMLQQERYYTQHNSYSAFTASSQNSPFKSWSGDSATTGHYEISAAACAEQQLTECVVLTASQNKTNPRSVTDPICGELMLDSANNKSYSTSTEPNPLCW